MSDYYQAAAEGWSTVRREVVSDVEWLSTPVKVSGPKTRREYDRIRRKVLDENVEVRRVSEDIHRQSGSSLLSIKQEARKIYDTMDSHINTRSTKAMAFFVRQFWKTCYEGIFVDSHRGFQGLKKALSLKKPVLLLPTHKSHIDYIILSYLFFEEGIPLPRVIAGENLSINGLGAFLKRAGAIYIRRSFGQAKLYRAIFTAYIRELINANTTLECFVEGGRSRVGKVLSPKIGFLQIVVSLLIRGEIPDVLVVPISVSYDKLVESGSFQKELLGGDKTAESLQGFINSVSQIARLNFGSINIAIGEAYSLASRIEAYMHSPLESMLLAGMPNLRKDVDDTPKVVITGDRMKKLCLRIGHESLYKMNRLTGATATCCVATILLSESRETMRGKPIDTIAEKVSWFLDQIRLRKGQVSEAFTKRESVLSVVDRTLQVMGAGLVTLREGGICMITHYSAIMELSIYRNAICHWFISESIVAVALLGILYWHSQGEPHEWAHIHGLIRTKISGGDFSHKPERSNNYGYGGGTDDSIAESDEDGPSSSSSNEDEGGYNVTNDSVIGLRDEESSQMTTVEYDEMNEGKFTDASNPYTSGEMTNDDEEKREQFNGIWKTELFECVQFVSQLLKNEFVYTPSKSIQTNFAETLQWMVNQGVIENVNGLLVINDGPMNHSDSSSSSSASTMTGFQMLEFLASFMWPFIDVYWAVAHCLLSEMVPNHRIIGEKEFVRRVATSMEDLYFAGEIEHFESLNVPGISNSLHWFKSLGLVDEQKILLRSPKRWFDREHTTHVLQLTSTDARKKLPSWIALMDAFRRNGGTHGHRRSHQHSTNSTSYLLSSNIKSKL